MGAKLAKDLSRSRSSRTSPRCVEGHVHEGRRPLRRRPSSSWGGGILYNKDLLAKVGFSKPPQTWDEFLALCHKLKDAGITPFLEATDGIPVTVAALVGRRTSASAAPWTRRSGRARNKAFPAPGPSR